MEYTQIDEGKEVVDYEKLNEIIHEELKCLTWRKETGK
jgi:hypothetical protein